MQQCIQSRKTITLSIKIEGCRFLCRCKGVMGATTNVPAGCSMTRRLDPHWKISPCLFFSIYNLRTMKYARLILHFLGYLSNAHFFSLCKYPSFQRELHDPKLNARKRYASLLNSRVNDFPPFYYGYYSKTRNQQ